MLAVNFDFDESALTGKSLTVNKQIEALSETALSLADRRNIVYMNTMVDGVVVTK